MITSDYRKTNIAPNELDDLRGIADVEKAREPFYTTKPEAERSGMGFTIMQTFMDECNVQSERGKGTKVEMSKTIGGFENREIGKRADA